MPIIAIVNRKGGSGKSTLAAHIAAWCAHNGSAVMLGDVDRQQSSKAWLARRSPALPAIKSWSTDQQNILRVPAGVSHVVIDTPGGIQGFELERIVMCADIIIMPVCDSVFDRESAQSCHAELMTMQRIANGRCKLATVGVRVDGRTSSNDNLRDWSQGLGMPYLGALRDAQLYVRSIDKGMTIFDLSERLTVADLAQWDPILQWLGPLLYPPLAANEPSAFHRQPWTGRQPQRVGHFLSGDLTPTQAPTVPSPVRVPLVATIKKPAVVQVPSEVRSVNLATDFDLDIPQFVRKTA